ncbi:putative ricin domain protein [Rhyzopertha dominica]|nr:putative ricin domain protein [Rhyzopertha dominica]
MVAIITFLSISGLCLQAVNNQVQVQPCDYSEIGQLWEFESIGDGTIKITNYEDGGTNGNCVVGAEIITYIYHGRVNQRWYYSPDGSLATACNASLVLDTENRSVGTGTGIVLDEKRSTLAPTQAFQFQTL